MEKEQRTYAYFDGSNFYHLSKLNYDITGIDFSKIASYMLKDDEILKKIKYYNSPVNQQEDPDNYAKQLKFFEKIKKIPLLEINLGRLAKRKINKISILCQKCGLQFVESVHCPSCNSIISLKEVYKTTEKGLDVRMATDLLLDSIENNFDTALIFSGDADFSPAIEYIVSKLKKKIIYCRFPKPRTNELIKICSATRIINKDFVVKAKLTR